VSSHPERRFTVIVSAHIAASTGIELTVYPGEDRVTVSLEGSGLTDVTLFADRLELVRLRDALSAALTDLDAQRGALAEPTASPAA
jgi:hypothetical protein